MAAVGIRAPVSGFDIRQSSSHKIQQSSNFSIVHVQSYRSVAKNSFLDATVGLFILGSMMHTMMSSYSRLCPVSIFQPIDSNPAAGKQATQQSSDRGLRPHSRQNDFSLMISLLLRPFLTPMILGYGGSPVGQAQTQATRPPLPAYNGLQTTEVDWTKFEGKVDPIIQDPVTELPELVLVKTKNDPNGTIYSYPGLKRWVDENGTSPTNRDPITKDNIFMITNRPAPAQEDAV